MRKKLADTMRRLPRRFRGNPLLSIRDVAVYTGWSRATIYRRIADDGFPPPVERHGRKLFWRLLDILSWSSTYNGRALFGRKTWDDLVERREMQDRFEAQLPTREARDAFRRARFEEDYRRYRK